MTESNTEVPEEVVNSLPPDPNASPAEPEPVLAEDTSDPEPETFPRDYVEKLRNENAKYRQRAGEADSLSKRLHTELVRATGRLADPTDLPFDPDHLADADKMAADIEDLLTRKPHLATRRPVGEIGQGAKPSGGTVDLAAILRGKAG
ncbi:hypothetical protein A5668_23270 [Mycolicibacterium fortuitum]|uniref:hypothetical protein n=1 Tax=Mycolicibacterium fortuitum TaxID=1766 RepID=UPI0007E96D6E|nr:hypothetical protein [Mycolicibacterium fortuitum]OBB01712.1 hypothetical protein A5668_23270 [Mycolicibacterium fortuitum]